MLLDVQVKAHQPLALGVRPAGTAPVQTQHHIPGSVLRGALAAAWIRDHGLPNKVPPQLRQEFVTLFESETVFGPLFATGSQIVPLSVRRCKYQRCAGIHPDDAFDDSSSPYCGSCGGPLTAGRGEVEFFGGTAGRLVVQRTHLEIHDKRQVASDGNLFTRRALTHQDSKGDERQFHGRIAAADDLPEAAARWLKQCRDLRLGGRRGTSGGVTYSAATASPRLPGTGERVALRLTAPAILTDTSGLPLDLADRDQLGEALRAELSCLLATRIVKVERVWARRERVGGWHAASNLPKPVELAVSAGSVLLLAFDEPPAPEALLALAGRGVGLRRNEGFGALETATSAWTPPSGSMAEDAPTGPEAMDPAESYARMLYLSGHSAWFIDQLRPYVEERAAGNPPHDALLERSRLRNLPGELRRDVQDLLLRTTPDTLDRTLARLAALHRLKTDEEQSS
ncbi:type III-B CRISPR module-associated Cmr3 family protein [Streptomyces sp. enrichment culture]|uniref:type III-B CRISPR module-associated Cmr3 family protein n=1 Tax=Streptomyces sp. enrichment culture TaxID=1795815 RepID=UPI003F562C78